MNNPLAQSLSRICRTCGSDPFHLAIILGSGLGGSVSRLNADLLDEIPYNELPILPVTPSVAGHRGVLQAAVFKGWRLLLFQGRFHLYQGLDARQASQPVRLAAGLGCPRLLLTNASGGIHDLLAPGDLLYLADHINLMGDNPLRGEPSSPFVDLSALYDQRFFEPLSRRAATFGKQLVCGVLAGMTGPSYETPAEIAALAKLGADAVSMSIIPEAILARYFGMTVVGLSLISNRAAGLATTSLRHQDVLRTASGSESLLKEIVTLLVELWQNEDSPTGSADTPL